MDVKISPQWKAQLESTFKQAYFFDLVHFVKQEYNANTCFPPGKQVFTAFDNCSFEAVKVIIIGQDPYHNNNQANGLAFSVNKGMPIPPSLRNIFKELNADVGTTIPKHGDLTSWAKQGVFLLNTILTVRAHQAGSHQGKGWEQFTDEVIRILSKARTNLVFLLWGSHAQQKSKLIDQTKHNVLIAPHPSPLSAHRGFLGCRHFSQTNEYLRQTQQEEIVWQIN